MKIKALIICEGNTDQILIGSYIENISDWSFELNIKDNPFRYESINWYSNRNGENLGIWENGSDDFTATIRTISNREKSEHALENILIVTDNDADKEINERSSSIFNTFINELGASSENGAFRPNAWDVLHYDSGFGKAACKIGLLLIPLDQQGALETFMLNALSENLPDNKETIGQVETFISDFKSEVYLRKRRERIKAKFGTSMAIFAPDKSLKSMKEIINSVNWEKFDTTKKQFKMVEEIIAD